MKKYKKLTNSWRHHYIPVFYLKGFTNKQGKFFIYDGNENRIIQNPKSPKSFFFEKNRHSLLNLNDEFDNFIESKLYNSFDNFCSDAILKLKKEDLSFFNNNLEQLSKIIMFINGLIYRVPKYDEYHNSKIEKEDFKEYFLPICDHDHNDVSYQFHLKNKHRAEYKYACRFSCSIKQSIPLPDEAKYWNIYALSNDYDEKYFLLSGDSPVLVNDIELFKTTAEIIIAPLTQKHFIIRAQNRLNDNVEIIKLLHLINIGVIIGSIKYVCSPNKRFLDHYIKFAEEFNEKILWEEIMKLFAKDYY